ncbi:hypothetical protein [Thioalkalivibrio sp. ALgr3]|uniref:hypothetical protein n=1 Tax=Thioalkalivibrio sp. ALgr3 TaxID=1239292 RepID=UPI0012DC0CF1|nr:hypothetical protein [Thioalkalivibrio sp. ALgr3]
MPNEISVLWLTREVCSDVLTTNFNATGVRSMTIELMGLTFEVKHNHLYTAIGDHELLVLMESWRSWYVAAGNREWFPAL